MIVVDPVEDEPVVDDPGSSSSTQKKKRGVSGSTAGTSSRGSTAARKSSTASGMVVKNGILYIIEDDPENVTAEGGGTTRVDETVDAPTAYSASDLAADAELAELNRSSGFWSTIPGYMVMIGIILALLLLALFFLFFGVIVWGEVEEHDEVFELCAIRLMRRREGNWYVRLGSAFDDNAVLRLRIGILLAALFTDWELTGETDGLYEGEVTGQISQNMLVYRKNIRRSV